MIHYLRIHGVPYIFLSVLFTLVVDCARERASSPVQDNLTPTGELVDTSEQSADLGTWTISMPAAIIGLDIRPICLTRHATLLARDGKIIAEMEVRYRLVQSVSRPVVNIGEGAMNACPGGLADEAEREVVLWMKAEDEELKFVLGLAQTSVGAIDEERRHLTLACDKPTCAANVDKDGRLSISETSSAIPRPPTAFGPR